ncbi:hypothetical protein OU789_10990 [Halocynthiibacter sp. C4]|uniref:hypothetical protein n=1 Tax=Halocynthiibacter sp. C4 TaxID=2992758 RepID=UPI00237AA0A9|nr:hypothetical protein [Halocynthiibacter sp. C4]MDE0590453.1 hypothetical protein [Halocynthiibacter sp. C4]
MQPIRWSDNDKYFGPFTLSKNGGYKHICAILDSGDGDEYTGCRLRVSLFGYTFITALPQIIKPWRKWVDTSHYDWSDNPQGGYWYTGSRAYGIHISDGHLDVSLGRVTHDSNTEQRWGCFLPWTQWRFISNRYYDAEGALAYTDTHVGSRPIEDYREHRKKQEAVSTVDFIFDDFDGERLTAKTRIEEYEHKFGTGWFKWLSLFRKRRIVRSLDIRFSSETGERKGSWKGGTVGHGITMIAGEDHEAAFHRYCDEHGMTFIGPTTPKEPT